NNKKSELIAALGDRISNSDGAYSPESYTEYLNAYDAILAEINAATTLDALNAIDVPTLKTAAEAKLEKAVVPDTISVDVTWQDITFEYNASGGTWQPESHSYADGGGEDTGWVDSSGEITVTNKSNVALDVTVTYKPPTTPNGTVSLAVDDSEVSLNAMSSTAPSHTFVITAQGIPDGDSGIGSILVEIKKKN
ncbi:MAG: hypothetical protein J6U68_00520, partial [Clostridia bacterium]|nr:hypothetical protein [Clostridia bacterium]